MSSLSTTEQARAFADASPSSVEATSFCAIFSCTSGRNRRVLTTTVKDDAYLRIAAEVEELCTTSLLFALLARSKRCCVGSTRDQGPARSHGPAPKLVFMLHRSAWCAAHTWLRSASASKGAVDTLAAQLQVAGATLVSATDWKGPCTMPHLHQASHALQSSKLLQLHDQRQSAHNSRDIQDCQQLVSQRSCRMRARRAALQHGRGGLVVHAAAPGHRHAGACGGHLPHVADERRASARHDRAVRSR
jgi:hypothetical protein